MNHKQITPMGWNLLSSQSKSSQWLPANEGRLQPIFKITTLRVHTVNLLTLSDENGPAIQFPLAIIYGLGPKFTSILSTSI